MKTDELLITQSPKVLEDTLDKIELIALYTGMSRKEASSMRLMAEEMLSATKGILEAYEGSLWMDTDKEKFTLHMRVDKPSGKSKRDKLVSLSKSGKATPPKGLFSRLGAALEEFLTIDDDENAPMVFANYAMYTGEMYGIDALYTYHYMPLGEVREPGKKAKPADELSGIEKSIIDAIVDDILVTVNSDYVEIIAVKNLK